MAEDLHCHEETDGNVSSAFGFSSMRPLTFWTSSIGVLYCWFTVLLLVQHIGLSQSLVVEHLNRQVNIATRIAKTKEAVTLFNPSATEDVQFFYVALPKDLDDQMGLVRIHHNGNLVNVENLAASSLSLPDDLKALYGSAAKASQIVLRKVPIAIKKQSRIKYQLEYYVGHAVRPVPPKIALLSDQVLLYEDRLTALSPYPVKKQQTTFSVPRNSIKEISNNISQEDATSCITEEILEQPALALGDKNVFIYYVLNTHLGHFPSVERQLEVSHWGSVSVKELYKFTNPAAGLVGEYDRHEMSKLMRAVVGRLRLPKTPYPRHRTCFQLESILPRAVYDVQFFDETGNISTSNIRREATHALLQVEPRYPILGGWNADWRVEYKLSTESVVHQIESQFAYRLTVPLGPGMKEVYTDSLTTKVILPNGAHNIQVTVPRDLLAPVKVGEHWGWLDLIRSRPYVELAIGRFSVPDSEILKHNLQIEYQYRPGVSDFTKPLGVVAMVLVPFLIFVVGSRMKTGFVSKTMEDTCCEDDVLEEVADLAKQIIDLKATTFNSINSAPTDEAIGSIKVHSKTLEMHLTLRLAQVSALSRDAASFAYSTKRLVSATAFTVHQYIEAMDSMCEDAGVEGRLIPEAVEERVHRIKRELHRLMAVIMTSLKKSESSSVGRSLESMERVTSKKVKKGL